jgi:hypothetical protein
MLAVQEKSEMTEPTKEQLELVSAIANAIADYTDASETRTLLLPNDQRQFTNGSAASVAAAVVASA